MKNKIFSLASQDELTPMSMNENGIFEGGFSILKTSEMSEIHGGILNNNNNIACSGNQICKSSTSFTIQPAQIGR